MKSAPLPDCIRKDAFGNCLPRTHETLAPHRGFYSHKNIPKEVLRGGVRRDPISVVPTPPPASVPTPPPASGGVGTYMKPPPMTKAQKDMYIGYYSYKREVPNRRSSVPLDVQEKALDFKRLYDKIKLKGVVDLHQLEYDKISNTIKKYDDTIELHRRNISLEDARQAFNQIRNRDGESKFNTDYDSWVQDRANMQRNRPNFVREKVRQLNNLETKINKLINVGDHLDKGDIFQNNRNAVRAQTDFNQEMLDLSIEVGHETNRLKMQEWDNETPHADETTEWTPAEPQESKIGSRAQDIFDETNALLDNYLRGETKSLTEAEINSVRKTQAATALESSVRQNLRPVEDFTEHHETWSQDWEARHETTPEQKRARIQELTAKHADLQQKNRVEGQPKYEAPLTKTQVDVEGNAFDLRNMHLEINVEGDVLHVNIPGELALPNDVKIRNLIANDTAAAIQEIKGGSSGLRGKLPDGTGGLRDSGVKGLRYKAMMQAIDDAIGAHPNIKQIDLAGHSSGGFWSRIATPEVAELMSTKFSNRNIKVKGMGLNAFVRDPKGLPPIPENAKFTYHEIVGDPTGFKQGPFLTEEVRNGAHTQFYPQSSDRGVYKGPSLFKNVDMDVRSPYGNLQQVRSNIRNQMAQRHQVEQFADVRQHPTEVEKFKFMGEVDAGLAPGSQALNRDLPVRTNEAGQLENFNPSAMEDTASLHSLNIKYPNAAAAAEGLTNLGYGAVAGWLGSKVVEAIDPNRQQKVAEAAKEMTTDFKEGKVAAGLEEAGKMTGQEAIHTGEYAGAVGAIDSVGRGLYQAAKVAITGGGPEAAAATGLSAAGAAFLPTAAAVAGGMVVSEGTKALMEWGGEELGINEDIVEPTSEIVADAAGGAAGAAIAGAVAAGMGYGAAAGPMGVAAGAALGALVGGGVEIYKHWDDVSSYMSDNFSNMEQGLLGHIDDIGGFINHLF